MIPLTSYQVKKTLNSFTIFYTQEGRGDKKISVRVCTFLYFLIMLKYMKVQILTEIIYIKLITNKYIQFQILFCCYTCKFSYSVEVYL